LSEKISVFFFKINRNYVPVTLWIACSLLFQLLKGSVFSISKKVLKSTYFPLLIFAIKKPWRKIITFIIDLTTVMQNPVHSIFTVYYSYFYLCVLKVDGVVFFNLNNNKKKSSGIHKILFSASSMV